jgi:DNA polymerase-4
MDAFYASVELRERPALRGKPAVVGALGGRGVVLSATYEARALGIHSAMPMSRAKRLCPNLIVLEPHHEKYAEVSHSVMNLFETFTPLVEPISLDEAFLDVAGARRLYGRPVQIASKLREQVAKEHQITCSVGIAPNKFIAKLASRVAKPDGVVLVPAQQVIEFLHPQPVSALWGVGEKTEALLRELGLHTVADVANTPKVTLERALGSALGEHLLSLARGEDERAVVPDEPEKSIGAEETFDRDLDDSEEIVAELLRQAERVAVRLRAQGLVGRTVAIKVRFSDFRTITRARTLNHPTDVAREIYLVAKELFLRLKLERVRVRLVGVRMTGLSSEGGATKQMTLGEPEHGWREAEQAADRASDRFGGEIGDGVVIPARLLRH